jgi:3-methylcrotonyl-CoA carboxylase beta subunit
MGPDQAASVLTQVRGDSARSKGEAVNETDQQRYYEEIRGRYLEQTTALFATARLWDDGIIEPEDTRATLGLALSITPTEFGPAPRAFGTFRM